MTRKELELLFCSLEVYFKMELESDKLDLKDKLELINRISKLKMKIYQKLMRTIH